MKAPYKKTIIIGSIIFTVFLIYYFLLKDYCTLAMLQHHREYLMKMVDAHYVATIVTFALVYTVFTACALPEGGLFSILGGFLFGSYKGTAIVLVCATIGATITFLATRYFIGHYIQKKYKERLHSFNTLIRTHGTLSILFIRLITIIPFFIVNLLAGITTLPLFTFVWATLIGSIPGTYAYALIGEQLKTIGNEKLVLSTNLLVTGIIIAVSILLGIGFSWWNNRKKTVR